MIVYVESSILSRFYLTDELGHERASAVMRNSEYQFITGSWTRIEVSGALVRAARRGERSSQSLLDALDTDLSETEGIVSVIDAEQTEIELIALELVRSFGIRSMDAWHLACARLALDELREPGEECGFATRDEEQAAVAREMGFTIV